MIFDYCVLVAYNIFVVETFEDIDLFFDGANVLFTYGYFLHSDEDAVIKVDALVDLAIGSLSDFLD